jgi:hypothetical protein
MLVHMDQHRTPASASPLPTAVDHLTGETVVRLMRAHGRSIRGLAESAGLTQTRVREVRDRGIRGVAFVYDWAEAITGSPRIHWSDVADLYLRGMRRQMPTPCRAAQPRSEGAFTA